jgi:hypothetical protein
LAPPARDRISVDLHGLKAALEARAQAERVGVSAIVRRAVERELGLVDASAEPEVSAPLTAASAAHVKLSIRMTNTEAEQFTAGARRAGLSRGAFLAGLLAGVPSLSSAAGSRPDCIAALTASSAELSTLTQGINRLTRLLREGDVAAAHEYRDLLDTLGDDVRAHLRLAGGVLADLQPARSTHPDSAPKRRRALIA